MAQVREEGGLLRPPGDRRVAGMRREWERGHQRAEGWHGDAAGSVAFAGQHGGVRGNPVPAFFPQELALQQAARGTVSCDVGTTMKAGGAGQHGCMAEQTPHFPSFSIKPSLVQAEAATGRL